MRSRREVIKLGGMLCCTGCLGTGRNTASDPPGPVSIVVSSEYPSELDVYVEVFEGERSVFSDSRSLEASNDTERATIDDVVERAGLYEVEVDLEGEASESLDSGRFYWSVDCTSRDFNVGIDETGRIVFANPDAVEPQVGECGEEREVPDEHPLYNEPPFEGDVE